MLKLEVTQKKILVAEKQASTGQFIADQLTLLGYKVLLVNNGQDAMLLFTKEQLDLIVLNTMLPKLDGYEVCYRIRTNSQVPIILLSSLVNISDRVLGFELGADDYLTKPFSLRELESRIKSILHRSSPKHEKSQKKRQQKILFGDLIIDMSTKVTAKGKKEIKLSRIEHSILELLIENAGKKLSRTMILENIWGYKPERYIDTRIVDVNICRLRSKIEDNPSKPDLIVTARGKGYMFEKY